MTDSRNEDWARTLTWDVTGPDGLPVADLDALARVLGTDRTAAARRLLAEPFGQAAPEALLAQARAALA